MTDIAIYEGPGGQIEVRVDRENIWLAQMQLVELFGRDQSVISRAGKQYAKNAYCWLR